MTLVPHVVLHRALEEVIDWKSLPQGTFWNKDTQHIIPSVSLQRKGLEEVLDWRSQRSKSVEVGNLQGIEGMFPTIVYAKSPAKRKKASSYAPLIRNILSHMTSFSDLRPPFFARAYKGGPERNGAKAGNTALERFCAEPPSPGFTCPPRSWPGTWVRSQGTETTCSNILLAHPDYPSVAHVGEHALQRDRSRQNAAEVDDQCRTRARCMRAK